MRSGEQHFAKSLKSRDRVTTSMFSTQRVNSRVGEMASEVGEFQVEVGEFQCEVGEFGPEVGEKAPEVVVKLPENFGYVGYVQLRM